MVNAARDVQRTRRFFSGITQERASGAPGDGKTWDCSADNVGGVALNHVGMLYDTLIKVVHDLKETDFRQDASPHPSYPK